MQLLKKEEIEAGIENLNKASERQKFDWLSQFSDEQPFLYQFLMTGKKFIEFEKDFSYFMGLSMMVWVLFREHKGEMQVVSAKHLSSLNLATFGFYNHLAEIKENEERAAMIKNFLSQSKEPVLLKFIYGHVMGNPELPKTYQTGMFSLLKVMIDGLSGVPEVEKEAEKKVEE